MFFGDSVVDRDPDSMFLDLLDPVQDMSLFVRIRIRILASSRKNCKENLDFLS
jgi:hypothetical protein